MLDRNGCGYPGLENCEVTARPAVHAPTQGHDPLRDHPPGTLLHESNQPRVGDQNVDRVEEESDERNDDDLLPINSIDVDHLRHHPVQADIF